MIVFQVKISYDILQYDRDWCMKGIFNMKKHMLLAGCCIVTILIIAVVMLWVPNIGDIAFGMGFMVFYPLALFVMALVLGLAKAEKFWIFFVVAQSITIIGSVVILFSGESVNVMLLGAASLVICFIYWSAPCVIGYGLGRLIRHLISPKKGGNVDGVVDLGSTGE